MAKPGRKPKGIAIDELPEAARRDLDLALESEASESARSIYARLGLSQAGVGWASFEKYATKKRRESRGRRIEERMAGPDDPRTEAQLIAELRRRAYIEALAALESGDAKLYEIVSTLSRVHDFDRLTMERAAEARAAEKHEAWKAEVSKTLRAAVEGKTTSGETMTRADVYDLIDDVMRGKA